MAFLEDMSENGLALPLGIGLAVAALSAGPKIVKAGRPVIKSAIKAYLALQSKSKEMLAESSERLQDVYAEARHEYEEEMAGEGEVQEEHQAPVAEGAKPARARRAAPAGGEA